MKLLFKEIQKFTQWWLWLFLIAIGTIPIYGIYKQIILGEKFGNNPMSDIGLIFFCIFIFTFIALFIVMKLETKIDQNEIRFKLFPFVNKRVSWKNIKKYEIVNYGFVGGWGIRLFTKYGTVYNIKGNKGLAIELTNGKKILIGTQKDDELNKTLERFTKKD